MMLNLITSLAATSVYLFLFPSPVIGQIASTGAQNAINVMNANVKQEKKNILQLAVRESLIVERQEHFRKATEFHKERQALIRRGSLRFPDGQVIVSNQGAGEQLIDPRTPLGLGDPLFRQIHVEQKIELGSLLSPHQVTELRTANMNTLQTEIASGWTFIDGSGSLLQQNTNRHRSSFMALIAVAPNKIIRRQCDSCEKSHQDIYYRRTDQSSRVGGMNRKLIQMMLGDVSGFYSSDCGSGDKVCQIYNRCDIDFTLHSTYQDAMSNINPWQACRNVEYGSGVDMYTASNKIGFPGYSGINHPTDSQFNQGRVNGQIDYGFFVEESMWIPIYGARLLHIFEDLKDENIKNAPVTLRESPHSIIRRVCIDCTDYRYKDIYYRRIFPVPEDMDLWDIISRNFKDQKGNIHGYDYDIHSTYDDAVNAENGWYCGDHHGPTPAPAPNHVIYEAEDFLSDYSGEVEIKDEYSGYTGVGYVDIGYGNGTYAQWSNIDGGTGGPCTLKFRYATGGTRTRSPGVLSINGNDMEITVRFRQTRSWSTYTYDEIETSCSEGDQTIRLTFNTASVPHVDSIQVILGDASGGTRRHLIDATGPSTECLKLCCFPTDKDSVNDYMLGRCHAQSCHYVMANSGSAYCSGRNYYADCVTSCILDSSSSLDSTSALDNSMDSSSSLDSTSALDNYKFYPRKDSAGFDIRKVVGKSLEELASICDGSSYCVGFNSNGWLKRIISDEVDFPTWTSDQTKGLYVSQTQTQDSNSHDQEDGEIIGFPGRCRPHINDPVDTFKDQWIKTNAGEEVGVQDFAFYIEGAAVPETGIWMTENDEMDAFLNPGTLDSTMEISCKDSVISVDTDSHYSFPTNLKPYGLKGESDAYAGWYDIQGCGKCSDWCGWFSSDNTFDGGMNPRYQSWTSSNDMFACVSASSLHEPDYTTAPSYVPPELYAEGSTFASFLNFFPNIDRCSGAHENSPPVRNYEYIGCYVDSPNRILPRSMGTGISLDGCHVMCRDKGYTNFGRQWNEECWCGGGGQNADPNYEMYSDVPYDKHGLSAINDASSTIFSPPLCNDCESNFIGAHLMCVFEIKYESPSSAGHTCKNLDTFDIPNYQDEFQPDLMPYKYQMPVVPDPYAGYYDVQRCGKCNDFCFWAGSSKDGSGLNPEWQAHTKTDHFTCKLAGGYKGQYDMTERNYFGKSFRFQKCASEGASTPSYKKEKYVGCFYDQSHSRALPTRIGTNSGVLDLGSCAKACRDKGYHYFGRQEIGYCYCGGEAESDKSYAKYGEVDGGDLSIPSLDGSSHWDLSKDIAGDFGIGDFTISMDITGKGGQLLNDGLGLPFGAIFTRSNLFRSGFPGPASRLFPNGDIIFRILKKNGGQLVWRNGFPNPTSRITRHLIFSRHGDVLTLQIGNKSKTLNLTRQIADNSVVTEAPLRFNGNQERPEKMRLNVIMSNIKVSPLSTADNSLCSNCDGSNIGQGKQCVFKILDQYDPVVERKKHECSHIKSINVRRYCFVSCRDANLSYKNLLACQTLKVTGLRFLNIEVAKWKDSPICDTKHCIKNMHPLGRDVSQDRGVH